MPFSLKTTPFLFQKAMTEIFQPLLNSALVYVDDLLLFFEMEAAHINLLQ